MLITSGFKAAIQKAQLTAGGKLEVERFKILFSTYIDAT
jgi:hypothetical protein